MRSLQLGSVWAVWAPQQALAAKGLFLDLLYIWSSSVRFGCIFKLTYQWWVLPHSSWAYLLPYANSHALQICSPEFHLGSVARWDPSSVPLSNLEHMVLAPPSPGHPTTLSSFSQGSFLALTASEQISTPGDRTDFQLGKKMSASSLYRHLKTFLGTHLCPAPKMGPINCPPFTGENTE